MKVINVMKTTPSTRQKGFALLEVLVAVGVIGLLALGVYKLANRTDSAQLTQRTVAEVGTIAAQSRAWKGINPNYVGVSIQALTDMGLLDTNWGGGTGINPFGGDYLVVANTANSSRIDISVSGMETEECLRLQNKLQATTLNGTNATCSAGTLTAIYR